MQRITNITKEEKIRIFKELEFQKNKKSAGRISDICFKHLLENHDILRLFDTFSQAMIRTEKELDLMDVPPKERNLTLVLNLYILISAWEDILRGRILKNYDGDVFHSDSKTN